MRFPRPALILPALWLACAAPAAADPSSPVHVWEKQELTLTAGRPYGEPCYAGDKDARGAGAVNYARGAEDSTGRDDAARRHY